MWRKVAKRISGSQIFSNPIDSHLLTRNTVSRPVTRSSDIHSFCINDWIFGDYRGFVRSKDLFSFSSKSLVGRNHEFLIESRSLTAMAASSSTYAEEEESTSLTSAASEIQQILGQLAKDEMSKNEIKAVTFKAEAPQEKQDTDIKKVPVFHRKRQDDSSHSDRMNPLKYATLKQRQIEMETEVWKKKTAEYQDFLAIMCKKKLVPNLPYMKSLFVGWFEPFRDLITKEQNICKKSSNNISHAPYFTQLPGDMMALITMHKLIALMMTGDRPGSARLITASLRIGEAVEHEVSIRRFLDKKNDKSKENNEDISTIKRQDILRKIVKDSVKKHKLHTVRKIVKKNDETKPWGSANHAKVGSHLIHLLLQSAFIQPPVNQSGYDTIDIRPAFRHIRHTDNTEKETSHRTSYGFIVCDPLIRQGLERTAAGYMVIPYIPMLVPPLNWTGYNKGGHFFLPSSIMRTHGAKQQLDALKRASKEQMRTVYKALNTLGNTKWRINQTVLSVVEKIWSTGGGLADLVNREDMPLPEKPDTEDETILQKWKLKLKAAKKENSERHSQRCDVELRLSVARKMKDEEGFYYPHNIDFRGRAYPMHPYLNHLGSDLCRGILEFADGRPLRKAGLQWLKIHLANVYAGGMDKLSYDGRITFADNHVEDIFDSADKPLEGKRWWLGAEDPFQCLAVCINLAEALRSSSPESTISHLPVHQDGSCNGLQHYAALGRDQLGAASVNLIAMDKPADVYSEIAKRVHQIMHADSKQDSTTYPDADYAKLLIDQVDRKMVKQTVMTSVYGVTFIGAREQIRKRLKERVFGDDIDDTLSFHATCYAAKVTLTALSEMFQTARDIMKWLGDCAQIIAKSGHAVAWTTPLGLPVVQPYMKQKTQLVKTSLQALALQHETRTVLSQRQRTAFAPNFVHSLDSSHMMMTAIACREEGLVFAGVHDSFWTHACDVDVMNRVLREKFVKLYEAPVLENLLHDFKKSYPSLEFPPLPKRGDFDLKDVLESTYFFN